MGSDHNGDAASAVPTSRAERDDWDRHWKQYERSAAENPAQAFRRQLVLRHMDADAKARILDIGSGSGELALDLRRVMPDASIAGLELSETGTQLARAKVPDGMFHRCDLSSAVEPPPELAAWATNAVCAEVLEHLDDPVAFLRNTRPFLAPHARLVVTVPGGPMSAFDRHIGHRRHFKTGDLRDVLTAAGFSPVIVTGAGFPFFNLYRMTVVLAGKRVVDSVDASPDGMSRSPFARLATKLFGWSFRLNTPHSRWGWQRIAVATMSDSA